MPAVWIGYPGYPNRNRLPSGSVMKIARVPQVCSRISMPSGSPPRRGRDFPDSQEIEAAFLAGMLAKPSLFMQVGDSLSMDNFADPFYGEVWRLTSETARSAGSISPVSIAARLSGFKTNDFDPHREAEKLGVSVVTTSGVSDYAKMIGEVTLFRRLHGVVTEASANIPPNGGGGWCKVEESGRIKWTIRRVAKIREYPQN